MAAPKIDLITIPLTALSQPKVKDHRLAPDDVLGVYIEGIIGQKEQPLPVFEPQQSFAGGGAANANIPPSVGYPIPVSSDGTISLPYVPPLKVEGLTIKEAQELIRRTYVDEKKILVKGSERILVSLRRPRQFRVQVVRQETPQITQLGGLQYNARKGQGQIVDLPAYENDVLNALTRSGGLPGLDSINEVLIQRNLEGDGTKIVRIPLRIKKGSPVPFEQKDVLLDTGDVIFIEARDTEVYYVAGLMNPRQFTLPRDYDLKVTEAVALAGGPLLNGGFNTSNLNGNVIAGGIGSPSPSLVTVVRKTKDGGQIKIVVNLNRAFNDPRENIIVQSGDFMVLQETLGESFTRYMSNAMRYQYLATIIRQKDFTGTSTGNFP